MKYLLEIGTEELPYRFIPSAIEQLERAFKTLFESNKIEFGDIKVYATPRRLAVLVSNLGEQSPDEVKTVRGPIKKIAYDETGNLSPAGLGFLKKNGLDAKDAYVEDDYLHAKIEVKGKQTQELLQENIPSIVLKLQGSHFMRWGSHEEKFSRPIRWIVSVTDKDELPIQIIDVKSSRFSRGHRFAQQKVAIGSPDDYVETLRNACVIVNQDERKQIILEKSEQEAKKFGAKLRYTEDLLEEVTHLCEYPVPCVCEFDEKYLQLPEEVAITVMAVHQRYFALIKNGKLINKFITITNYIGDEFANIKAGNVRVIKARLDDAVFFLAEDTKKPLEKYVDDLKGMTFQKGMGTVLDKTQRIVELAKGLNNSPSVLRTALLCKADLATQLVFEFTELQGFIGADYARISGETAEVCNGIKEHYFPLNAESELAEGIEGQIVGIADKIDTICAVFAQGKKPTGSSDPLGVRRAALGVIKTIINKNLMINLSGLIAKAISLLPVKADCQADVEEFFKQRLVIYLAENYKKEVLEACVSNKNPLEDLKDFIKRVEIINQFDDQTMLESAVRVSRILKEDVMAAIDEKLFKFDAEGMLYKKINEISATNDYNAYLKELEALTPCVTKFFDDVLIMDSDLAVQKNRLALLTKLKSKYYTLADFSKL